MKKYYLILAVSAFVASFVLAPAVRAAINFNDFGPLNFDESNLKIDFSDDINKLSLEDAIKGPASPEQAKQILRSIGDFFVDVNTWLEQKAGIRVIPILKAIGSLFVYVVEKMIELIKFGLGKI